MSSCVVFKTGENISLKLPFHLQACLFKVLFKRDQALPDQIADAIEYRMEAIA